MPRPEPWRWPTHPRPTPHPTPCPLSGRLLGREPPAGPPHGTTASVQRFEKMLGFVRHGKLRLREKIEFTQPSILARLDLGNPVPPCRRRHLDHIPVRLACNDVAIERHLEVFHFPLRPPRFYVLQPTLPGDSVRWAPVLCANIMQTNCTGHAGSRTHARPRTHPHVGTPTPMVQACLHACSFSNMPFHSHLPPRRRHLDHIPVRLACNDVAVERHLKAGAARPGQSGSLPRIRRSTPLCRMSPTFRARAAQAPGRGGLPAGSARRASELIRQAS